MPLQSHPKRVFICSSKTVQKIQIFFIRLIYEILVLIAYAKSQSFNMHAWCYKPKSLPRPLSTSYIRSKQAVKTLHGCVVSSEPSLVTYVIVPKSHFMAPYSFGIFLGGKKLIVELYRTDSHILASTRENMSSGICEQQRHRLAQTDQHLYCSLIGKYHI